MLHGSFNNGMPNLQHLDSDAYLDTMFQPQADGRFHGAGSNMPGRGLNIAPSNFGNAGSHGASSHGYAAPLGYGSGGHSSQYGGQFNAQPNHNSFTGGITIAQLQAQHAAQMPLQTLPLMQSAMLAAPRRQQGGGGGGGRASGSPSIGLLPAKVVRKPKGGGGRQSRQGFEQQQQHESSGEMDDSTGGAHGM